MGGASLSSSPHCWLGAENRSSLRETEIRHHRAMVRSHIGADLSASTEKSIVVKNVIDGEGEEGIGTPPGGLKSLLESRVVKRGLFQKIPQVG